MKKISFILNLLVCVCFNPIASAAIECPSPEQIAHVKLDGAIRDTPSGYLAFNRLFSSLGSKYDWVVSMGEIEVNSPQEAMQKASQLQQNLNGPLFNVPFTDHEEKEILLWCLYMSPEDPNILVVAIGKEGD